MSYNTIDKLPLKTNSKAHQAALDAYLLPLITEHLIEREQEAPANMQAACAALLADARACLPHEFKNRTQVGALEYFLCGLGLSGIDFYYFDIVEVVATFHGLEREDSERFSERLYGVVYMVWCATTGLPRLHHT
jgi:hypothetical protein